MMPYYDEAGITIYHGDCLNVLDGRDFRATHPLFDLALVDPPYNVGVSYDGYHDSLDRPKYRDWVGDWFDALALSVQRTVVFPGHGNLDIWMPLKPSGVGCWHKPGNPAGGGVFQFCEWEPFLLWGKAKGLRDVQRAPVQAGWNGQKQVGDHPCPKPLKLFTSILYQSKAESVIDPFVGSGTTLVAAKSLGIPAVGIEQSERYCEIAAKRLAQEVLDFGGVR